MKKFIFQIVLFSSLTIAIFLLILSQANGFTDPFYIRFTTPKQNNLILGTSRAAQGIQPSVLDSILNIKIFNYAFTLSHSPFGPTYLKSIKKKLNEEQNNGTFIIAVDPWSITSSCENPNDSMQFRELQGCLGKTHFMNINPNFDYLINNLKGKYYSVLNDANENLFLHDDGWLEVTVDMDSVQIAKRTKAKLNTYSNKVAATYQFSSLRHHYLIKTISYLKKFGNVYLVRLPVSADMMEIEKKFMPDFNIKMKKISGDTKGYLDLSHLNTDMKYTDGNHLHKTSGKMVTNKIARWIHEKRQP